MRCSRCADGGDVAPVHGPAVELRRTRLVLLHRGIWVEEDDREAAMWFAKAAQQGYPRAQVLMGECFEVSQRRAWASSLGAPSEPS